MSLVYWDMYISHMSQDMYSPYPLGRSRAATNLLIKSRKSLIK